MRAQKPVWATDAPYHISPNVTSDQFKLLVPGWKPGEDVRFKTEHYGPFRTLTKLVGVAIWHEHDNYAAGTKNRGCILFGMRSLTSMRESGYAVEGRVSVLGRSFRAFTSSQLLQVDNELVSIACLFVCCGKVSADEMYRLAGVTP